MPSTLATALGATGPVLTGIGALPQFYEWQSSRTDNKKIADIRDHIDWLDQSIDDLKKEDKTLGLVTEEGIDIGKAFAILQDGAAQANKINRRKLRDLTDELDKSSSKRAKYVLLSVVLVLVGTTLWAVASFV